MAPNWARATRPLVIVFALICFAITLIFEADVEAQGGAYATGVLVLMTSAAIAVTISAWYQKPGVEVDLSGDLDRFSPTRRSRTSSSGPTASRSLRSSSLGIVIASFVSRAMRTTEIRIEKIELDDMAQSSFLKEMAEGEIRIVTNRRETGDVTEYRFKEHEKRDRQSHPSTDPILFYEIDVGDASEFTGKLKICGVDIGGIQDTADECAGSSKRDRGTAASSSRQDRQDTARLFRLERGESDQVSDPLHSVWRRRHGPGHARDTSDRPNPIRNYGRACTLADKVLPCSRYAVIITAFVPVSSEKSLV